tara:strand:- start:76 stop:315 length:240 start_codon:yes stop_codon:yes gene_type:complete
MSKNRNPFDDIKVADFRTLYLEDFRNLQQETIEILFEAVQDKKNGDQESYEKKMLKYETFKVTTETMLLMAAKYPLAEA